MLTPTPGSVISGPLQPTKEQREPESSESRQPAGPRPSAGNRASLRLVLGERARQLSRLLFTCGGPTAVFKGLPLPTPHPHPHPHHVAVGWRENTPTHVPRPVPPLAPAVWLSTHPFASLRLGFLIRGWVHPRERGGADSGSASCFLQGCSEACPGCTQRTVCSQWAARRC